MSPAHTPSHWPHVVDVRKRAARVRHLAAEGGYVSYMNNARWRQLCRWFYAWPVRTSFRIHSFLAAPNYVAKWDGEWYYHPYPYVDIKRMEILIPSPSAADALAACKQMKAAVQVAEPGLMIWGWVGPADRPEFA